MDAELVNKAVQQVIDALRRQGASAATAKTDRQFVRKPTKEPPDRLDAKVFLTAQALAQRLAGASSGSAVELAHNEFLTPAAQDLAESRHLSVRRSPRPTAVRMPPADAAVATQAAQAYLPTLGLVTSGQGDKIAGVVEALRRDGVEFADYNQSDCWMCNIEALAGAFGDGGVAAGVAMLPFAADAMVLANKIAGVRAVQGTRADSVAAAVRRFDANMLILEHSFLTFHEMRAMVRLFAAPRLIGPSYAAMMQRVAQLEGNRSQ